MNHPNASLVIEFDAIDTTASDIFGRFQADDTEPFALLCIHATSRDFQNDVRAMPQVGEWFGVEVEPAPFDATRPGAFHLFHAQLGPDGYGPEQLGQAASLTPLVTLGRRGEPVVGLPSVVGDGSAYHLPPSLVRACAPPRRSAKPSRVAAILAEVGRPDSVLVRDVGQASFTSLCDGNGRAILHYDVGLPTSFNGRTAPPAFDLTDVGRPPVILSHWDWDHICAAFRFPHLLDLPWIVPAQRLGPGAARMAKILRKRGNLHVVPAGAPTSLAMGELSRARGRRSSLNDTGLTVGVTLSNGRTVMLTGDADYSQMTHSRREPVDHLVATHHGAWFDSSVKSIPRPKESSGQLALSVGKGNVYRHPHDEALAKHLAAGWANVVKTSDQRAVGYDGIVLS